MVRTKKEKKGLAFLSRESIRLPRYCTVRQLFESVANPDWDYKNENTVRRVSREGGWLYPARVEMEGSSMILFDCKIVLKLLKDGKKPKSRGKGGYSTI